MCASCVLPVCYLLTNIVGSIQEAHIVFFKANFSILSTFLGSTQEAHMCASWVLPSVTSLTEHSVDIGKYATTTVKYLIVFSNEKNDVTRRF